MSISVHKSAVVQSGFTSVNYFIERPQIPTVDCIRDLGVSVTPL